MDAVCEGIKLAVQSVRAAERDDGLRHTDAIRACMDGFDSWAFAPYGEDANAVKDAAWSWLTVMFTDAEIARCEGRDEAPPWGTTPTTGYVPDCSPTGVALAVSVSLRDGYWYVVGLDVPVARGTSVYATREGAVYAARRRWRCNLPGLNSGPGRREARKAVQP